jgi:hypothetical protein
MKKITIGSKPTSTPNQAAADAWVNNRQANPEPMKRLTIDVPLSLHQRVKSQCALKGEQMANVMRELLEQRFSVDYEGRELDKNSDSQ